MPTCHHPTCSLNIDGHCAAADKIALDTQGRCVEAQHLAGNALERILGFLERFSPYPFDKDKDREFFTELLEDFPDTIVLAQIKAFHAWILDLPDPPEKGYRSMIRKWIQRAYDKSTEKESEKEDNYRLPGLR